MNVEIGTEAAQFPEKEYINGIFVAVWIYFGCLPMPACLRRPGPDLLVGGANVQQHLMHVRPMRNDLHRVRTLDNPADVKRKLYYIFVMLLNIINFIYIQYLRNIRNHI